jgi:thiamine-monophosphate kinase
MNPAPLSEFSLIERFFACRARASATRSTRAANAALGIGDDCALIAPTPGQMLAISTDMLVEGRHFFADVDPHALGHKTLAVNLSDLAAMGATPRAFTLACALPQASETWLAGFSDGLFELAERFECELIGGDTTRGPLNLCVTVFGDVPPGAALTRSAACENDDIWVSGVLGDARAALGVARGEWSVAGDKMTRNAASDAASHSASDVASGAMHHCARDALNHSASGAANPTTSDISDIAVFRRALDYPEPRIALGIALRGLAHAALDISDGLAGDLHKII